MSNEPFGVPSKSSIKENARKRLGELIAQERKRAQLHIRLIRQNEPAASNDRVAQVIVDRWVKIATVEGGITGTIGFAGIPLNFMIFAYMQLAMVVSIAEAYQVLLEGESGEEAVVDVIGRAHGVEDVIRAGPRVLGAIAKALALSRGLSTLGRLIPMVAAPISAKLNEREMSKVGREALRRFGNVVQIES